MKSETILITGGARSGKSRMALELASSPSRKLFIATATASDPEMKERIEIHQKERGPSWETLEVPLEIEAVLKQQNDCAVVVDCLTLWLSNLMFHEMEREIILQKIDELSEVVSKRNGLTVIVTNEVGLGIVPENELARTFRDLTGILNQRIASVADRVILMVSGLSVQIKGGNR